MRGAAAAGDSASFRRFRWLAVFRQIHPARLIHDRGIAENGGQIRVQQDNIRPLAIARNVLAAHSSAEVDLRDVVFL